LAGQRRPSRCAGARQVLRRRVSGGADFSRSPRFFEFRFPLAPITHGNTLKELAQTTIKNALMLMHFEPVCHDPCKQRAGGFVPGVMKPAHAKIQNPDMLSWLENSIRAAVYLTLHPYYSAFS
jgi:hypothetical protein